MYLSKVPVLRIKTGLLLYDVIKLGKPNFSISSQRKITLNLPTQGFAASAALDGTPALLDDALLFMRWKHSGASMQN